MNTKKVAIIGAGVSGLCSAYYLDKAGYEVIVVSDDEGKVGCSYGNAGMIVPSHFIPLAAPGVILMGLKWMLRSDSPFYIKPRLSKELISWGWKFFRASSSVHVQRSMGMLKDIHLASRELYIKLKEKEQLDFELNTTGLLMLCKTRHGLEEEAKVAQEAKKMGLPAEVISSRELEGVDPGVQFDLAGGVYFPMDAFLDPQAFMNALTLLLKSRGVKFIPGKVQAITRKGNKVKGLKIGDNELVADEFVVAAGIWSPGLLKSLGISIPMQGGKGYSVMVDQPVVSPRHCSILTEARVSMTPMGRGVRFGGTMELNGTGTQVNRQRLEGIFNAIPRYYPQFKADDLRSSPVWVGLRPCSPDGLPYIGKFKNYSNLTAATGHAMMGMSLGPITGKLVSQIISNERPSIDISLLNPDRYN